MTNELFEPFELFEIFGDIEDDGFDRIKTLIESGVIVSKKDNYGRTAFHYASLCGHFEIVKLLVKYYVDTNAGSNISEKNNYGWTALHYASYHGYFDIVKYLVKVYIDTGLDIDITNNEAKTAIDVAKTEEIKEFLMEQLEIQQNSYILK